MEKNIGRGIKRGVQALALIATLGAGQAALAEGQKADVANIGSQSTTVAESNLLEEKKFPEWMKGIEEIEDELITTINKEPGEIATKDANVNTAPKEKEVTEVPQEELVGLFPEIKLGNRTDYRKTDLGERINLDFGIGLPSNDRLWETTVAYNLLTQKTNTLVEGTEESIAHFFRRSNFELGISRSFGPLRVGLVAGAQANKISLTTPGHEEKYSWTNGTAGIDLTLGSPRVQLKLTPRGILGKYSANGQTGYEPRWYGGFTDPEKNFQIDGLKGSVHGGGGTLEFLGLLRANDINEESGVEAGLVPFFGHPDQIYLTASVTYTGQEFQEATFEVDKEVEVPRSVGIPSVFTLHTLDADVNLMFAKDFRRDKNGLVIQAGIGGFYNANLGEVDRRLTYRSETDPYNTNMEWSRESRGIRGMIGVTYQFSEAITLGFGFKPSYVFETIRTKDLVGDRGVRRREEGFVREFTVDFRINT